MTADLLSTRTLVELAHNEREQLELIQGEQLYAFLQVS